MAKIEHPLQALDKFLPPNTFLPIASFLQQYKVHLTITRSRKTVLGDYRNAHNNRNHRISVNGNLNQWSFIITLLHELAHLLTFEKYGNRVQAHGSEWKQQFRQLLATFLAKKIFPADIETELYASLENPAASSCAEDGLMRILRKYDPAKEGHQMIEEIAPNILFKLKDGKVFRKGERLRKRYKCEEIATGKWYLFSPVFEVEVLGILNG